MEKGTKRVKLYGTWTPANERIKINGKTEGREVINYYLYMKIEGELVEVTQTKILLTPGETPNIYEALLNARSKALANVLGVKLFKMPTHEDAVKLRNDKKEARKKIKQKLDEDNSRWAKAGSLSAKLKCVRESLEKKTIDLSDGFVIVLTPKTGLSSEIGDTCKDGKCLIKPKEPIPINLKKEISDFLNDV